MPVEMHWILPHILLLLQRVPGLAWLLAGHAGWRGCVCPGRGCAWHRMPSPTLAVGPSSSSIGRASRWALRGLLAGLLPEAQHLHGDAALPGARRVCACQPHVPPTLGMVAPLCPLQGAESEVLGCVVVLEAQHSAQLCLSVTALEALVVGLFSWRWLSESEGVPAPPVSHSKHCCWVPLGHRNHGAHLGTTWEPVL